MTTAAMKAAREALEFYADKRRYYTLMDNREVSTDGCAIARDGGDRALQALALLDAASEPVDAPEGWQLVPKEPTQAMILSARSTICDAVHNGSMSKGSAINDWVLKTKMRWQAMLAAAPKFERCKQDAQPSDD